VLSLFCPAVLEATRRDVQANVRRAAQGGDGWTKKQFVDAAFFVLDAEHSAVLESEMATVVGAAAVRALVKANVFSVRPYSEWALDVDEAAFAPAVTAGEQAQLKDMIITAASPVYLFCIREQRKILQRALHAESVRNHDKYSAVHYLLHRVAKQLYQSLLALPRYCPRQCTFGDG
jgi:hypothetical protein